MISRGTQLAEITVFSADNKSHIFPEGTAREVIDSAMKKYAQRVAADAAAATGEPQRDPEMGMAETAARGVASGGTGILRGLAGLAGMIPDVHNMISGAVSQGARTPNMRRMPGGSEDIKRLTEQATGITPYQPQTTLEKFIARAGQGAVSMVPTTAPQALVGATAGMAGEAAANSTTMGKEKSDLARLAGELTTLLLAAPFGMKTPPNVRAVKNFVEEAGVPGLREGAANAATISKTTGAPTLLTQGMPNKELSGVVQALANSPYGGAVRNVLKEQLPAGEALMGSLYKSLPKMSADELLKVGGAAIKAPKEVRKGVTEPLFAQANEKVDATILVDAIDKARLAKNIPLETPKPAARRLLDDMTADPLTELTGIPALQLETVARKARDAAERARKSGDSTKMLDNYIIKNAVDDATGGASKALVAAKSEHARLSEELVNPVKKVLGKMFPQTMQESKAGDLTVYRRVFDAADAATATKMSEALAAVDPQGRAFQALFRDSLQAKAEAVLKPVEGRVSESAFNSFANEIAGTPTKRAALEAKVAAIAKAQGKDPAEAVKGTNEAIDALYAISKDRGGINPGAESLNAAANDWVSNLLQYTGIMYPAHGLGRIRKEATVKQLAIDLSEAFTTPKGVDKLIDIARFSGMNHKIKAVARGLSTMENQYDDKPKLNVYGQE